MSAKRFLRSRLLWLVPVIGVGAAVYALAIHEPRIGRRNFDKITTAWTRPQVEELLGEGRERDGQWFWGETFGDLIILTFDRDGQVQYASYVPDNLTPFQRLYRRLRSSSRDALSLPPEP